jgi:simple sugar transport system ATP-binding protein
MVGHREEVSIVLEEGKPREALPSGEGSPPLLRVERLRLNGVRRDTPPRLRDIAFDVRPGEVFGIAGVDGNGQAELAECLSGLLRPDEGHIFIGDAKPPVHPAAFRKAGVAVIPADRHRRGLALPLSLTENLTLGVHDDSRYRRGPLLRWRCLRERAAVLLRRFDVRATGPDAPARSLSGGNQQKVVIARALAEKPRVVIAVNPTRGLDVGATAFVHEALRAARADGAAIVLISTELDEVLSLADRRVAVLYEGAFSANVAPDTPREQIGLLMGGRAEAAEARA